MQIQYLSHTIATSNPVYGAGNVPMDITNLKSLAHGDSCNTFRFGMENHWGTHIDAPGHFFVDGKQIADYPADTWLFSKPYVLQISLDENQLLEPKDLIKIPENTDILLIKSGFGNCRDKEAYYSRNPGFLPETGLWLRKNHPYIRAVGFDFISVSCYQKRDLGRRAHQAFLDPDGAGEPILIIEDMNLCADLTSLFSVVALPLRIEGIDSSPCTVLGWMADKNQE